MSTASWRKNTSLVRRIEQNPQEFTFIQIVRLLERAANISKQLGQKQLTSASGKLSSTGHYSQPNKEAIRFAGKQTLGFPESEVSHVYIDESTSNDQWQVVTDFIGLTGAMGVLPYHYTEFLLQRVKQKDQSLLHFLDLFHHRIASLFYRASTKYRLPLEYDKAKTLNPKNKDNHTQALLAFVGLLTPGLEDRQYIKDESLLFFAGLLNQQVRTPSGLQSILQHYFDLPVNIEQFVGQWQSLILDVRTRLPHRLNPKGQNVCLGRTAMLGSKGWFAQGKIRINIGPLNKQQFDQLAPGTRSLKALNELVRIYLGVEHDFDFNIQVKRCDIPKSIRLGGKQKAIVGWNTWLSHNNNQPPKSDALMNIHLSPNRAH